MLIPHTLGGEVKIKKNAKEIRKSENRFYSHLPLSPWQLFHFSYVYHHIWTWQHGL